MFVLAVNKPFCSAGAGNKAPNKERAYNGKTIDNFAGKGRCECEALEPQDKYKGNARAKPK